MSVKPSDSLPPPPIRGGDTEEAPLYTQVGRALSAWEAMEDIVARLFSALVGDRVALMASPATRAYGTVATFRGRKEMVSAAAQSYFFEKEHKGRLAEIKSFLNSCSDWSARRNEIAHGVVRQIILETHPLFQEELTDLTYYLIPANYNSNKVRLIPRDLSIKQKKGQSERDAIKSYIENFLQNGVGKYKYNSQQVSYYADGFAKLAESGEQVLERFLEYDKNTRSI